MLNGGQYEIGRFRSNRRKVVFIAEYKATSCMGPFLAFASRRRKGGEWEKVGPGKNPCVPRRASSSSLSIRELLTK